MANPLPLPRRLNARNSVLWCTLDIGGVTVRAYLADRNAKRLTELHEGRVGWFDSDTGTILIGWDVPDDLAENTLLHEMKHAEIFNGGIKLHPDHEVDDDEEELIVNQISCADYDALKRNGMLVFPPRPALPARARRS